MLDFGGEGTEENNWAVVDGPFADLTLYLGPGTTNTVHPLTRQANESAQAGQQFVDAQLSIDTFAEFKDTMRPGIHFAGHKGVGGEVRHDNFPVHDIDFHVCPLVDGQCRDIT